MNPVRIAHVAGGLVAIFAGTQSGLIFIGGHPQPHA